MAEGGAPRWYPLRYLRRATVGAMSMGILNEIFGSAPRPRTKKRPRLTLHHFAFPSIAEAENFRRHFDNIHTERDGIMVTVRVSSHRYTRPQLTYQAKLRGGVGVGPATMTKCKCIK